MTSGAHPDHEDFVVVDCEHLPLRQKEGADSAPTTPRIDLSHINVSTGELLVSIVPPREPSGGLQHTPCDIVLVIDISTSMSTAAEIPTTEGSWMKESSGWSILDLVKHASSTVLESLNEGDRLAIVTFSTDAKVIQGLLPMTASEKAQTRSRIEALTVDGSTNLWAGIRVGLGLFTDTPTLGNAQGMYVLTDGVPNHLNPAQGFCKKLAPLLKELKEENGQVPMLSTFGFGYRLRSSLLRSIAEVGRGSYSFIPDAGMIGTVFVHAVANLLSTSMSNSELIFECSNPVIEVEAPSYYEFNTKVELNTVTMNIGNIQYGQSRDIVMKIDNFRPSDVVTVTLRYRIPHGTCHTVSNRQNINQIPFLSQSAIDYHISRHRLCEFLASLSYKCFSGEHAASWNGTIEGRHQDLEELISDVEARLLRTPASVSKTDLAALLADLKSSDPTETRGDGQISLALQTTVRPANVHGPTSASSEGDATLNSRSPRWRAEWGPSMYGTGPQSFWTRWGQHYIPSILHAHAYQLPISFKDPGPLRYASDSPLFIKCRDDLDNAFDRLPTPAPSLTSDTHSSFARQESSVGRSHGGSGAPAGVDIPKTTSQHPRVHISRFNRVDNVCFAGECLVRVANSTEYLRVDEVHVGDILWTASGQGRAVRDVVVTQVTSQELIGLDTGRYISDSRNAELGMLWITPWHPVFVGGRWTFPQRIEGAKRKIVHRSNIYSFLLDKESDDMAHTVEIDGVTCVTLGHGLVDRRRVDNGKDLSPDVRHHHFFGDHDLVAADLKHLETDAYGRRISGGIGKTGGGPDGVEVYAFVRPAEAEWIRASEVSETVRANL